ncbi:hypothetical protein [Patulibacter sp.]|uniref:hypothetical protein n=1 Tax=Patulibacter sp. TaxID=1912859 RepID=UPI00271DF04A|nr:hypothetical protein [Patulibacter sp.]MDO9408553.1 hypothetical protein [Patulibacter sp.]
MSSPGNYEACAVCDRHLLRGEQPEIFLHDGARKDVCELCVPRALYAGWIRVGVNDAPTLEPARRRGASIVERLRRGAKRDRAPRSPRPETAGGRSSRRREQQAAEAEPDPNVRPQWRPHRIEDEVEGLRLTDEPAAAPLAAYASTSAGDAVHVTTSGARMTARAIDLYNHSDHPRRLAGIARTLGAPWVTVRTIEGSRVQIVLAWELTWYRFELDLAREADGVRATGQGTSLQDLTPGDVDPNAVADDHGYLYLQAGVAG